ncbi:MAG: TPM domain-containing protein [Clostridia bacterium]|nr:TPM domain-containing protein [Clostridia bacterium]
MVCFSAPAEINADEYYEDYGDDYYYEDTTDDYYDYGDYGDDYYYDDTFIDDTEIFPDDSDDYDYGYDDGYDDGYNEDDYYDDGYEDSTDEESYGDENTDENTDTEETDDSGFHIIDNTNKDDEDSENSESSSPNITPGPSKEPINTNATPSPDINPPSPNEDFYVLDRAGVLSSEVKADIIAKGEELFRTTGAQVVLVTIPKTTYNLRDYSYTLFNNWGIGGEKKYGLLFLLSIEDDNYYAYAGAGLMNKFDNRVLSDMNTAYLETDFRDKNYSAGADALYGAAVTKVNEYMQESGNAVGIASENSDNEQETSADSETNGNSPVPEATKVPETGSSAGSVLTTIGKVFAVILIIVCVTGVIIVYHRITVQKQRAAERRRKQRNNRRR